EYWNPFYRLFYILLFFIVDGIVALSAPVSTTREETPQLVTWNVVTHVAALFIPLGIWTSFLPQPGVAISWALEFIQVYFHGGSPAASDGRLFIMTLLSWSATAIIFLGYYYGGASIGVPLSFALGFTLSHDVLLQTLWSC